MFDLVLTTLHQFHPPKAPPWLDHNCTVLSRGNHFLPPDPASHSKVSCNPDSREQSTQEVVNEGIRTSTIGA